MQAKQEQPTFPCKTIDTLFSHRRHRIALQAQCAAFKQHVRNQNEHSGLLALPDELLVRPFCKILAGDQAPKMAGYVEQDCSLHCCIFQAQEEGCCFLWWRLASKPEGILAGLT